MKFFCLLYIFSSVFITFKLRRLLTMNLGLYYPPFNVDSANSSSVGPRWTEWINGFDLMLKNCKVAQDDKFPLLLRFAGRDVRDIFASFPSDVVRGPDLKYSAAKNSLAEHFRKLSVGNKTYQAYLFSHVRQEGFEAFDSFVDRLQDAARDCDFEADGERRIRDQIVMGCRSDDVRRKAFTCELSLKELVEVGKDLEDETDSGLLTFDGDVLSVFAPRPCPCARLGADTSDAESLDVKPARFSHFGVKDDPEFWREYGAKSSRGGTASADNGKGMDSASSSNSPSNAISKSPAAAASSAVEQLSRFNGLRLNYDADMSKEEQKKEHKKELTKERRRRQRRETYEAAKMKPFDELTDKQKKFLEYQKKIRSKWNSRRQELKRGGAAAVGSGGGCGNAAVAAESDGDGVEDGRSEEEEEEGENGDEAVEGD